MCFFSQICFTMAKNNTIKPAKKAAPKKVAKTTAKPKITRKPKKDYEDLKKKAEGMYLDTDLSQKEIARILDVSEVSLSKWATDGNPNWEELRKLKSVGRPQALAKMYQRLIQQVDDKENSDSVYKTLLIIKELEDRRTVLPDLINTMKDFSEFLMSVDLEAAKQFVKFQTAYIQKKVNERK